MCARLPYVTFNQTWHNRIVCAWFGNDICWKIRVVVDQARSSNCSMTLRFVTSLANVPTDRDVPIGLGPLVPVGLAFSSGFCFRCKIMHWSHEVKICYEVRRTCLHTKTSRSDMNPWFSWGQVSPLFLFSMQNHESITRGQRFVTRFGEHAYGPRQIGLGPLVSVGLPFSFVFAFEAKSCLDHTRSTNSSMTFEICYEVQRTCLRSTTSLSDLDPWFLWGQLSPPFLLSMQYHVSMIRLGNY
jgi:hypothetical protein